MIAIRIHGWRDGDGWPQATGWELRARAAEELEEISTMLDVQVIYVNKANFSGSGVVS